MTSKERAYLRKAANGLESIFQVGKNGVDDALTEGVGMALGARELIKLRVQDSSPLSAREAADLLADRLGAETVQVIGKRFVLYRQDPDAGRYGVK